MIVQMRIPVSDKLISGPDCLLCNHPLADHKAAGHSSFADDYRYCRNTSGQGAKEFGTLSCMCLNYACHSEDAKVSRRIFKVVKKLVRA